MSPAAVPAPIAAGGATAGAAAAAAEALALRTERARERVRPFAEEYPFAPHFHAHQDHYQHYLDEGPRGPRAVLCLHGNPSWSFLFRSLVAALAPARRVVAPDHLGCGLSDQPVGRPLGLEEHVVNLERLVLALGLERLTLVLHDWGGPIGLGFARRHPERVERLVILNTAAFRPRSIPRRIALCRLPVLGPAALLGLNAFTRAALSMAVERPLSSAARRAYLAPTAGRGGREAVLSFVRDIPLQPDHPSRAELDAIEDSLGLWRDRPALIAWGERDWCFTPAFREEWQRKLPQAEVARFERAGHWLLEDDPVGVTRAIATFLDRSEAP